MQLLGGLAVLAGLGLHATASSEEEEGNTVKAEDHRKQGNEVLAGGAVLWLLGTLLDGDDQVGTLRQRVSETMRDNVALGLSRDRIGIVYRWRF